MIWYLALVAVFFISMILFLWWIESNKQRKEEWKWGRKHIRKRKNIFMWFSLMALLLAWSLVESVFGHLTMLIIISIHAILWVGYIGWSAWQIWSDYKRVQRAISRRSS